jgi:hypothetical protein
MLSRYIVWTEIQTKSVKFSFYFADKFQLFLACHCFKFWIFKPRLIKCQRNTAWFHFRFRCPFKIAFEKVLVFNTTPSMFCLVSLYFTLYDTNFHTWKLQDKVNHFLMSSMIHLTQIYLWQKNFSFKFITICEGQAPHPVKKHQTCMTACQWRIQ